MNTVKRAVIVAAGEGRRMRPVTLTTPKSLVRVNGTRMIDTVIRGCWQTGSPKYTWWSGISRSSFRL